MPAEIVALMDAAGVQRLMLSAWRRPGRWLITNDEVAAHVEAFPDRFAGVATVDLPIPWRPPNDKLYYPLYVRWDIPGPPMPSGPCHT
jgi:predicted TIM-barrel fold metal-dependent hydrolase